MAPPLSFTNRDVFSSPSSTSRPISTSSTSSTWRRKIRTSTLPKFLFSPLPFINGSIKLESSPPPFIHHTSTNSSLSYASHHTPKIDRSSITSFAQKTANFYNRLKHNSTNHSTTNSTNPPLSSTNTLRPRSFAQSTLSPHDTHSPSNYHSFHSIRLTKSLHPLNNLTMRIVRKFNHSEGKSLSSIHTPSNVNPGTTSTATTSSTSFTYVPPSSSLHHDFTYLSQYSNQLSDSKHLPFQSNRPHLQLYPHISSYFPLTGEPCPSSMSSGINGSGSSTLSCSSYPSQVSTKHLSESSSYQSRATFSTISHSIFDPPSWYRDSKMNPDRSSCSTTNSSSHLSFTSTSVDRASQSTCTTNLSWSASSNYHAGDLEGVIEESEDFIDKYAVLSPSEESSSPLEQFNVNSSGSTHTRLSSCNTFDNASFKTAIPSPLPSFGQFTRTSCFLPIISDNPITMKSSPNLRQISKSSLHIPCPRQRTRSCPQLSAITLVS